MVGEFKLPVEHPKFSSPEEEIAFLREKLSTQHETQESGGLEQTREQVASEVVEEYAKKPIEDVIHEPARLTDQETEGIVLSLEPEEHDNQIGELLGVLQERGIKNALGIVDKMNNPHIADDFHRFLVQYVASGHDVPGLRAKNELWKELHMRLFEVTLPIPEDTEKQRAFTELVSLMEQFFAGMQSVGSSENNKEKNWYSLELALSQATDHVVFYVGVPEDLATLFSKQVQGLYPEARVEMTNDDYNIFNEHGGVAAAYGVSKYQEILSIKTYDDFDNDPLAVVLNVFSKLQTRGEGAAIQFIVRPAGDRIVKSIGPALDALKDGATRGEAMDARDTWGNTIKGLGRDLFTNTSKDQEEEKKVDEDAVESVTQKLSSTIVETNFRIITSAESQLRAEDILHDIESAFNQFTNTKGNAIEFKRMTGRKLKDCVRRYSYREFHSKYEFPINFKELASLYHFPMQTDTAPQLKQSNSGDAPLPIEMGQEGIVLGDNRYRGDTKPVHFDPVDRMRHFYMIGQTGVGKTTLFLNMIIQDIQNGEGVCYIDPHGTDIQTILSHIPKDRIDDVIYFDPAYTPRPMGLNMLEYDPRYPEQKTFVINELMGIFNKLFDMKVGGGAMFEQYFRNSAGLVMEDPDSGSTLLEITRVLANKEFRDMKLRASKNPIINAFWKSAEETTGDQSLANFVPYISSKFDNFISNEIMRPVVLQQKSAFNFRKIMDERKILLVNLSKGRLGEINSNLIGLVLVGKMQMAALSRVDMYGKDFPPFYLYIDEFQNVTTDSIASILSEARKYKLSLNITHQYLAQLEDSIRDAVFGNVGSMSVFRVSSEDAKFIAPRFDPVFEETDLMKIDNWNAYMSMLVNGLPARPFSMKTRPTPPGDADMVEKIKQISYLTYGRDRDEVEKDVMSRLGA